MSTFFTVSKKSHRPLSNPSFMDIEQLKATIRQSGLKCTSKRLAVLEYLVKAHRPVSTLEVIQELKEMSINEVTIYRILESFVEKKIIRPVDHHKRHRLYEAHMEQNGQANHAHFTCLQCDQILCLEEKRLKITSLPLPSGFQMKQAHLQIEGICPQCTTAQPLAPAVKIPPNS